VRSAKSRVQGQPLRLKQVQQAIPPGAALMELAQYQPVNLRNAPWGESRDAAHVLHPKGQLSWVDVGKPSALDRTVLDLRAGLGHPNSFYVESQACELNEEVMRPISKLLGSTRRALLSPEGELNIVPFGALIDEHNRYLVKHYTFTYLTSGRDLLRAQVKSQDHRQGLIVANPDYDAGNNRAAMQIAQSSGVTTIAVFLVPAEIVKNKEDRLVILNDVAKSVIDSQRNGHPSRVFTYRTRPLEGMYNNA
jgi:CHAT domain-containing protein